MKRLKLARLVRSIAARVFKRELVLLPLRDDGAASAAAQGTTLLPVLYTYRASPEGRVTYRLQEAGRDLQYHLYTMAFAGTRPTPGKLCLATCVPAVKQGATLEVNLLDATVSLDGQALTPLEHDPHQSRKFIAELQVTCEENVFRRVCSHYLPFDNKPIGRDYYFGDDYSDYPRQTEVEDALRLVRAYCSGGRLLDVGCALGVYTRAFLDTGFDAHGVDISEFAIAEAAKRVDPDRVRQCNLDVEEVPFVQPFDVVWMWDVLEHSVSPRQLLERVTCRASGGAHLFIHTSNADSLTRRLFGKDWEGYSDYSHHGIEQISVTSLAKWLKELGWGILDWKCHHMWVGGADPVLLRLRDAFHRIPELALFLSERNLGDMISVVARKQACA
jgi:2-polyprenyl-3-methyl-5-hydroxy-6-metoxy-1,4-benzoquinol methylase